MLFASTLSLRPDSLAEVHELCSTAPIYAANLTAMHLNASLVEEYCCNLTEVEYASSSRWMMYSSRIFVQIMLSASNVEGWERWLCENLDERRLHNLYLREQAVKLGVCEGAEVVEGRVTVVGNAADETRDWVGTEAREKW